MDGEGNPLGIWAEGKAFKVTIPDTGTGINQTTNDRLCPETTQKVIINGQIFILRGEHLFDVQGKMLK